MIRAKEERQFIRGEDIDDDDALRAAKVVE